MASQSSRNLANNNILFYRRRRSGARGSEAFELLKEWGPDGLALDFTDDFHSETTGFYGSAAIAGGGTQDGYDTSPTTTSASLLTYTSPSVKMTMGPSGTLRYQAHNEVTSSEDLTSGWAASQRVTRSAGFFVETTANGTHFIAVGVGDVPIGVRRKLTAEIKPLGRDWCAVGYGHTGNVTYFNLTGSGSIGTAAPGSLDATIEALPDGYYRVSFVSVVTGGTVYPLIASATGDNVVSFVGDVTKGLYVRKVHDRRYPADDTYLATTSAARYDLPFEWDESGALDGLLVEEARTNICLYSNNLTQSAWVKTNATAAKTATGPDGVANSASTLTATGANGVAVQNLFSASAARSGSVYLKRRTGTGAVSLAIGETTGSELVVNGDFATNDLTGWTNASEGTGTVSAATGAAVITSTPGNGGRITQAISVTSGKLYALTATISGPQGATMSVTGAITSSSNLGAGATHTRVLLATATGEATLGFEIWGGNGSTTIDNVTAKEVVESTIDLSSGNWVRAKIENKTITNPCVAIKLATSGDEIDVAYSQMETGAFCTSPIETFGATVTRAADDFSLATSAYPHSATVGTAMIEYVPDSVASAMVALRLDDNTTNEVISIGHDASANIGLTVTDGGAAQTGPLTSGTATAGAVERIAVSWKANDFLLSDNGNTAVAYTSGTLPTVTSLDLGPTMSGQIKRIVIVPYERSAAEVEALATAE